MKKIRKWANGAVRDNDDNKIEYDGFLSPIVLQRFGEYMRKHQTCSDGSKREASNWMALFGTPEEHKKVCMQSLLRHVMDLWLFHRGYEGRDTKEEALCAIMFNSMAYLYAELINKK